MGPTASGKTALALFLAQHLPCEIISVDSAMIYRGMDIGTAKPEANILNEVPHHLINILDPAEHYSAAEFRENALTLIAAIQRRGHVPLLVGGTMLYFHALLHGLAPLPSADPMIRQQLTADMNTHGLAALYERLQKIDPLAASRINANDPQRIQRALEVYLLTGKPMSQLWATSPDKSSFPYEIQQIALIPDDRMKLHQLIAERFKDMLARGLIEEVEVLFKRDDLTLDKPALRTVGYRQIWQYLAGTLTHEEMTEKAITATRQLAKRQLTWLRQWKSTLAVYDPNQENFAQDVLARISHKH